MLALFHFHVKWFSIQNLFSKKNNWHKVFVQSGSTTPCNNDLVVHLNMALGKTAEGKSSSFNWPEQCRIPASCKAYFTAIFLQPLLHCNPLQLQSFNAWTACAMTWAALAIGMCAPIARGPGAQNRLDMWTVKGHKIHSKHEWRIFFDEYFLTFQDAGWRFAAVPTSAQWTTKFARKSNDRRSCPWVAKPKCRR